MSFTSTFDAKNQSKISYDLKNSNSQKSFFESSDNRQANIIQNDQNSQDSKIQIVKQNLVKHPITNNTNQNGRQLSLLRKQSKLEQQNDKLQIINQQLSDQNQKLRQILKKYIKADKEKTSLIQNLLKKIKQKQSQIKVLKGEDFIIINTNED